MFINLQINLMHVGDEIEEMLTEQQNLEKRAFSRHRYETEKRLTGFRGVMLRASGLHHGT
jgi:NADH:ubiquinone oxidoreductase subunit D